VFWVSVQVLPPECKFSVTQNMKKRRNLKRVGRGSLTPCTNCRFYYADHDICYFKIPAQSGAARRLLTAPFVPHSLPAAFELKRCAIARSLATLRRIGNLK
jgi:hypothetical protein